MIKTLSAVLRAAFDGRMKQAAPEFAPVLLKSPHLHGGDRVYRRDVPGLSLFLVLTPSPTGREMFTVELAWSTMGRFPEVNRGVRAPTPDRAEFARNEFTFRLPRLATGKDIWFSIRDVSKADDPISADRAKKLILPLVEEALEIVSRYGLPYFDELMRAKLRT